MQYRQILVHWKQIVEILLLWWVIYASLLFLRNTRGRHVVRGIIFIIIFFAIAQQLRFEVINWLLTKLFAISVIAFIIIFQPELRRGLARLGGYSSFGLFIEEEIVIDEIVKAAATLAKRKIGALIAIEREVDLAPFIESGVALDSKVTAELITTIFMPNSPLHDGGIVIEEDKIRAASCLFPLSQSQSLSRTLGMRHRAGVGLSEETDAVVIIVSEETGTISIAIRGRLTKELDLESLKKILTNLCRQVKKKEYRKLPLFDKMR